MQILEAYTKENNWTPNMPDYDAAYRDFNWDTEAQQLGLPHLVGGYNIASLCLDKQTPELQNRIALKWLASNGVEEEYTFAQMNEKSNQVANWLQSLGIKAGDRIFIFLDRVPELYIALFGALKIQAIVGPLFSAFGPDALQDRIQDCGARLVITSPALKPRLDGIVSQCPSIEKIIIVDRTQEYQTLNNNELNYYPTIHNFTTEYTVPYTEPDTLSVIHYTSGTTGKPKGAIHRHYAVLAQAVTSKNILDIKPDTDIYWCTADPGWVTGTSYGMFGPWALGVTQIIIQAGFKPETWYKTIQDYHVTVWYTAPTAIRMLMKAGTELPKQFDLSSLRIIHSVGEPLNPEAIFWGQEVFGKTFIDTWWQTETGSMHICNYACMPVKPGSMGKPHPGIEAAILDEDANELPDGEEGHLVLRPTSPSFFRTYWQREEVYQSRFKKDWYFTGDRAKRDTDGYYWFIGRADDVINTAGHLVGPFEVESALIEHPAVAEAGVIGIPDEERLEIVKAFVALHAGFTPSEALKKEIQLFVRNKLAAHAYPRAIDFIETLPKTRSGKIMRRLLKARELGLPEGDLSTLED